jgi:cell division septal protein FtsQ
LFGDDLVFGQRERMVLLLLMMMMMMLMILLAGWLVMMLAQVMVLVTIINHSVNGDDTIYLPNTWSHIQNIINNYIQ